MAEQIILTSPVLKPSQTSVTLDRVTIDYTAQSVLVQWIANTGEGGSLAYLTPPLVGSPQQSGAALIALINGGNFAAQSLAKTLMKRVQSDGALAAGSITGTPA